MSLSLHICDLGPFLVNDALQGFKSEDEEDDDDDDDDPDEDKVK
jgi:hypothetical protein